MVKREMLEAYEEEEKVYLDMGKVGVKGREIDGGRRGKSRNKLEVGVENKKSKFRENKNLSVKIESTLSQRIISLTSQSEKNSVNDSESTSELPFISEPTPYYSQDAKNIRRSKMAE